MNGGKKEYSILVTDDNPDNLRVLEETLKASGHTVRVATNGEMALTSARTLPPDLILLDINMPKMDGYETCRQLKEDPNLKDIPVIFLSALTETFNKLKAFDVGGVAYLTKPFEPKEVIAYVDTHIGMSVLRKEIEATNRECQDYRDGLETMVAESTREIIEGMEKYTTLVEESNDGIVIIQDGIAKFANKKMFEMARLTEEESIGKPFLDFICEKDKMKTMENYKKRMAGEDAMNNYEIMLAPGSGECEVPVEINATRINYEGKRADMAIIRDISARKNAEAAIEKSRKRYEMLTENVSVGIWHADPEGKGEYINPKLAEIVGISVKEAEGEGWAAYLHPEDRDRVFKEWTDFVKGDAPYLTTYRFVRPNGNIRWVVGQAVSVHGQNGELIGHIGSMTDITKEKKAEEELNTLSEVVKQSPMHIVITDPKGSIEYVNPAFSKITGYSLEEAIHKNPRILQSGETPREAYNDLWHTLLSGKTWKGKIKNKKKDGSLFWERATISPSMDSEGNIQHLVAVKEDITEMLKVKEDLLTARRHYEDFINVSKDSVTYWQMPEGMRIDMPTEKQVEMFFDAVCVEGNKAASEAYGLSDLGELKGKRYGDLVKRSEVIEHAFDFFAKRNYLLIDYEYHRVLADGSEIYSLENWYGAVEDGVLTNIWASSKNVTEMKEAEDEIREKEYIIESASSAISTSDLEGNVVYVNPASLKLWGFDDIEEIRGRPFTDFWMVQDIYDEIMGALNNEGKWSGEIQGKRKDGSLFDLQVSSALVRNAEGTPIGLMSSSVDITKRKKADIALRESEAKLKEAEKMASIGHWELDLKSNELYWSDEVYGIFDIDPYEFGATYEAFVELIHPDDRETASKAYKDSVKNRTEYNIDHRLVTRKGEAKFVHEQCKTYYDEDGNPERSVGTVQDVTERKEAEEEIKASLEEKTIMLREIHHRVKNNLQIMLSLLNLQVQRGELKDVGPLNDFQSRIQTMALVHESLYGSKDLSKIEFVHYARMLGNSLAIIYGKDRKNKIETTGDELYLDVDTAIPCGLILNELISNSFKHAFPDRSDGVISVEIVSDESGTQGMKVFDNGVGLSEEMDLERSDTLGFHMVSLLTKQIGATLTVNNKDGTEVSIMWERPS